MMWTELAGFWLMPLVGVGLAIVVVWLLATLWRQHLEAGAISLLRPLRSGSPVVRSTARSSTSAG